MAMVVPIDVSGGAHAEYVVLDPRQVCRTPGGLRPSGCAGHESLLGRDSVVVVRQVWMSEYRFARDKLDQLRALFESNRLSIRVADTYPIEAAYEAYRRLETGGVRGQLVLTF
jgi:D-arabinose 1-dehydrogenase-like Zn-dependent alcohol dehydrogenase